MTILIYLLAAWGAGDLLVLLAGEILANRRDHWMRAVRDYEADALAMREGNYE